MRKFSSLVAGCTIAKEGYRPFAITLLLGLFGVMMVSVAPVFLKYFIDALTSGASLRSAGGFVALMLTTYTIGSILYELKWLFFTRSDRYNYLGHMSKLLGAHPQATAMRLHRAAQSNGKYLAILFLTILPIVVETLMVAGSVAFVANTVLAACLLSACAMQLCLVFGRTKTLNPLFTTSKEHEFDFFQKLERLEERKDLSGDINAWYDTVTSIN